MNNEKIIITDCDGILTDWEEAFDVWMSHQGYNTQVDDFKKYYSVAYRYDLSDHRILSLVKKFNESAAIGFLPPQRDAQYYVKLLHERHQFKFVVLTSVSDNPKVALLRQRNLYKLMGKDAFKDIICLPLCADKKIPLMNLSIKYKGSFWIEDSEQNVDDGLRAGFRGILLEHKFNLGYTGKAKIVKSWKEIYNLVIQ